MAQACFGSLMTVAMVALALGCGSSHSPDGDAGITFDAMRPDTGARDSGPRDARVPVCGDSILDPMEQCDDGNTAADDGCDGSCRREAYCGDNMLNAMEVCDDGNNASGDGCRSDCRSDETCGNGIRDVVTGELCDDGNTTAGDGCSADCMIAEGCGDGTVDAAAGETCDDGNTVALDGCGADCRTEISMVIDTLMIGGEDVGCDYSGDGRPDNTLAEAFGDAVDLISGMIDPNDLLLLMHFMALDDPSGANDPSVTVAWFQGEDADTNPDNNLGGMGQFHPSSGAFETDGSPVTSFASMIMSNRLAGGPEDIDLPFEEPVIMSDAVLWMAKQPIDFTANILTIADLRARGVVRPPTRHTRG